MDTEEKIVQITAKKTYTGNLCTPKSHNCTLELLKFLFWIDQMKILIFRLLMRNLEQKSGFGAGLGKNPINPFQTVDLKKALTDTVLELSTAFGRYWENNFLPYVPRHIESSGATCHVPHRSYKSATGVSPGSTATIALLRDGYELVVAQVLGSHSSYP